MAHVEPAGIGHQPRALAPTAAVRLVTNAGYTRANSVAAPRRVRSVYLATPWVLVPSVEGTRLTMPDPFLRPVRVGGPRRSFVANKCVIPPATLTPDRVVRPAVPAPTLEPHDIQRARGTRGPSSPTAPQRQESGAPMLVERETELTRLAGLFDLLLEGESQVALVVGEGGVGKTSLVNAMVKAAPAGLRIWRGGCDNLSTANPFGPFREALRCCAGELSEALARTDGLRVLADLAEELASGQPTLLSIEDLHWADDASIDVLAYLSRRLERLQVLLVVTFRDDELRRDHSIHRFLAALSPDRTQRLRLKPLSLQGVTTLARDSGWDPAELHATTAGNPFFVTETLASPPGAPVPATVAAAVDARLQALSAPAREALERVCVWPGLLDFEFAQELLGDGFGALTEAEEAGVLVVEPTGVRFRHEIARRATAARLTGLRRREHDRRVTEALIRRGEQDLSRLVHHAAACGDARTVATFAPKAARQSSRAGAQRQALAFYQTALQHELLLDEATLAEVLDGYSWELHNAHRLGESVAQGQRAQVFYRASGDHAAEAMALVRLTRPLYLSGELDQARVCAQRAVELTQHEDPHLLAQALAAFGALCALDLDAAAAQESLTRAREIATRIGDAALVSTCLNYLAQSAAGLSGEQCVKLMFEGLAIAVRGNAHEMIARGYTNLAELLYRCGDYSELDRLLAEGMAFAREHGFWSHLYGLENAQALLMTRRGEWDAAAASFRIAIERYDDPGMLLLYCLPPYLRLRARRGELTDKRPLVEAWESAMRQRWLTGLGLAGAALLEWAWLYDDPGEARRVLRDWEAHAQRPTAAPIDGEMRRYAALTGVELPARSAAYDATTGPWARGLGGDWKAAARTWQAAGDAYEAAIDLLGSGNVEATIQAWQCLTDLGAKPAARQARRRLQELGVRAVPRGPNRRTRTNPSGLTERQMDVARALADGKTNAEIADELVVSVRTVDHHVSAILTKFGLTSRRAVAAVVRDWQEPEGR